MIVNEKKAYNILKKNKQLQLWKYYEILEKEEEYWDWTTTQLDLIETIGIENYIQSQV